MSRDMSLTWQLGIVGIAGVVQSFSDVDSSLRKVKDSTKELVETQKKLENLDKISQSYGKVSREYANAIKHLSKLKEEYEKTGKGNAEFAKKVKETEKYVEKLNKQKERQKHIFNAARSELEKEGIKLEGYKKKLEQVNNQLIKQAQYKKEVNRLNNVSNYGDQLMQKGSQQIITGLGLGKLALYPIKTYAEVEESQADLKKMIDFKNKAEEEAYFEQIRKLSEASPLKQTEVYEIAGAAAQAGIAKEDIVEFTERAMKLKVAFDMSTEASGEFIAKSKEQLGLTQQQTFAFADTINYMADNTAAKASELVEISNRVGGLARTQNISKETNVAFGATLLSMGTSAEVASTGLKQLYLELGKGADTKKKLAAFEYLGLNPNSINKDMARDAEGTIVRVLEKINQLDEADKTAVLNDLFGEQAINSVATLATNIDKVKTNLEKAHSTMTAGSVDKEYANRMNTLTNTYKQTFNSFMNTLADMGKSIAPELKETLKGLKETFSSFANWVKENPKIASSLIKVIGSLALFNLTMGLSNRFLFGPFIKGFVWFGQLANHSKFGGIIYGLKKMYPLASSFFSFIFKAGKFLFSGILKFIKIIKVVGLAIKAAFIANPVGVIIAAIVAAIAIFVVLYRKVEWFRDGVNKIFGGLVTFFSGIWNVIKGIFTGNFDLIKQGFSKMVDGLKGIWEGFTGIISKTWNRITGFFKRTKDETKEIQDMADKSKTINKTYEVYENWRGTNYFTGGLTTVAERGADFKL